MALVRLCTARDVPEALVIRSALEAYEIRVTLVGVEHCQQYWFMMFALNSIPVLVSEADRDEADEIRSLAERQTKVEPWIANAFWHHPFRNSIALIVPWLFCGVFLMPWFRDWPRADLDGS